MVTKKEIESMYLTFYKTEEGRWFVNLPDWGGSTEDLEMVCGADVLLDIISMNHRDSSSIVTIRVHTNPQELSRNRQRYVLKRRNIQLADSGKTYWVSGGSLFPFDVWLCDVTKFVFGEFPRTIYIEV